MRGRRPEGTASPKRTSAIALQEVQNIHYTLGQKKYADFRARADEGDDDARQWVATFLRLAEVLKIRPPMD